MENPPALDAAATTVGTMRLAALAFVVAAAVVLTGCVPQGPAPVASPDPTFEPVFASDEEALAAAEAAYGEYQAVVYEVLAEGGANPERLEKVAGGDFLRESLSGMATFSASQRRVSGIAQFRDVQIQRHDLGGREPGFLTVYLCDDASTVEIVGNDGVVTVGTASVMVVAFGVDSSDRLLIFDREVWKNNC